MMRSWVESANLAGNGFPLEALPFCAFYAEVPAAVHGKAGDGAVHLGVGIGGLVLDLHEVSCGGHLRALGPGVELACRASSLNALMGCGAGAGAELRAKLMQMLGGDAEAVAGMPVASPGMPAALQGMLVPMEGLRFALPVAVANYTDFYASIDHATNVGRLFRPENPLLPNYKYLPIGYHGRASSLVVSGTAVRRPRGQRKAADAATPEFGACRQLDYELEVAAYVGVGNLLGEAVGIDEAESRLFGLSLLNDWSARDVQAWEAQPLGPFLGKSFATSLSPWVVPMAALEPYRTERKARPAGDPEPLDYLNDKGMRGALDVVLEVWLKTAAMKEAVQVSSGNLKEMYWTFAQMLAHHTSNGCNLMVGDVLGSGTVSGETVGSEGCLLERTKRGTVPLALPGGETRAFLEDGDEVILKGYCEKTGLPRISLGECRGVVLPAR